MKWPGRLLVSGVLIGILGILVAPDFAAPDEEDLSVSYFDDDDDAVLWVIPDDTPAPLAGAGSFFAALWLSAAVVVLAPYVRFFAVASPVLLRSPPGA